MFGKKKDKPGKASVKKVKHAIKLSGREKALIIALISVFVGLGSYFFVWVPQDEKLNSLAQQEEEFQAKVDENNLMLSQEPKINAAYKEAKNKEESVANKYFSELEQSAIIYKMNDILFSENASFPRYAFSNPQAEDINDFKVQSMSVGLPFDGSYSAIIDTLHKLKSNPQKIMVENISIQRDEAHKSLSGNMGIKFYTLDNIRPKSEILEEGNSSEIVATPIADSADEGASYTEVAKGNGETAEKASPQNVNAKDVLNNSEGGRMPFTPFLPAPGTEEEEEKKEIDPKINTELLSFDSGNYYFLPSHDMIKGNVRKVNKAKEGKALRIEYDMVAIEDRNYALVDVSEYGVSVSYPPDSFGLWVFSYDYSPLSIGLEVIDQVGNRGFFYASRGIGWTGWKHLVFTPEEQSDVVSGYPLSVDKLFLEMPAGSEGKGVLIFDKFEVIYERNIDEEGADASLGEHYISYVVEYGDTYESISKKFYGSTKYVKEIKTQNEIRDSRSPEPGMVLILKRR